MGGLWWAFVKMSLGCKPWVTIPGHTSTSPQLTNGILQSTGDAIWAMDTERNITMVNQAMRVLASNNRAVTPSEVAEWTQTERHNITALVDRMRRDGLVTTEPNSSDKRLVNITMTDKGREVLSQAMPVARKIVNQVMSSLTEADATLLERELGVLRQNTHHGLEHVAKVEKP